MAWPSKSNRATKPKRAKESGKARGVGGEILFTWNTVNEHTSLSFFILRRYQVKIWLLPLGFVQDCSLSLYGDSKVPSTLLLS